MNRGQVTVFVIIGLVLLILISFLAVRYFMPRLPDSPVTEGPSVDEALIKECLKDVSLQGFNALGEQGMINPKIYMLSKSTKIAYFYYEGKGYFPGSISAVESDVAQYIAQNIAVCTEDSPYLKPQVKVSIQEKTTDLEIKYPSNGKLVTEYIKLDGSVYGAYMLADSIYQKAVSDPETIDLDFGEGYDVRLIKVEPTTVVYEITDNTNGPAAKPFVLRFAMKYSI